MTAEQATALAISLIKVASDLLDAAAAMPSDGQRPRSPNPSDGSQGDS